MSLLLYLFPTYTVLISPDNSKPFLAAITAMISLITAAAAIVPCTMLASSVFVARVEQAIHVKTSETPECGSNVRPRYFFTVSGIFIAFAPSLAPKYFPKPLAIIYKNVYSPAPKIRW